MNIVLIGARGSGKSAVAREIAQTLGRTALSTDAEIERRAGASIKDYVAQHGWDAFRDLEAAVVNDLASINNVVLDTGGGVVLRPQNVSKLRANGRVFWLQATVDTLASRIKDDKNRPSLTGGKSFVDEIAEVLGARTPLYTAAAHHFIATEGRSPAEIAAEIVDLFHAHPQA